MDTLRLGQVRQDVRKIIEPYLERLIEIHKENIISIALYGSATGKYFLPKRSDINLVIILKELEFIHLKKSLKLVDQGIKKKIAAPLFLSLSYIETSKDTFPIEFMEIKENNMLLYGKDIFKDLDIDTGRIAIFCERDIKGKFIRLQEAYLEIGLKRKGIEALMKESMYALMPIFRALLRLKGYAPPPVDKKDILVGLADHYSLDKDVFIAILNDKVNNEKIAGKDVEIFFEKYLGQIKKLAKLVHKL